MQTVTATYAQRHVHALLREVEKGKSFLITYRGEVVAKIQPIIDAESTVAEIPNPEDGS